MGLSAKEPYRFLTPVRLDDPHDDARYPRLTARGEVRFVREPGDGRLRFFAAEALKISHRKSDRTALSLEDVRLVCCLTDTRLVLIYRDFAARGEWAGLGFGMLAAAAINHRNRRVAARDQEGFEAAMQVRLQWVASVTAGTALGLLRSEVLAVAIKVGDDVFDVIIRLVKGGPTAVIIANDLLRLTAEHWLGADLPGAHALDAENRAGFEKLRRQRMDVPPKQTRALVAPCWFSVSDFSARLFLTKTDGSEPRPPISPRPRYDGVGR